MFSVHEVESRESQKICARTWSVDSNPQTTTQRAAVPLSSEMRGYRVHHLSSSCAPWESNVAGIDVHWRWARTSTLKCACMLHWKSSGPISKDKKSCSEMPVLLAVISAKIRDPQRELRTSSGNDLDVMMLGWLSRMGWFNRAPNMLRWRLGENPLSKFLLSESLWTLK